MHLTDIIFLDRLETAIKLSQNIMEQSAAYLLYRNNYSANTNLLSSNTKVETFETLPSRKLISLSTHRQTSRYINVLSIELF